MVEIMHIFSSVDGSVSCNPGISGWSWYINGNNWQAGGLKYATNNQAELFAVLNLLKSTSHLVSHKITILCDSQYVVNSLTVWKVNWQKNGWRKSNGKKILNLDILKTLYFYLNNRYCKFKWIKGHAGNMLNEAADQKARNAVLFYKNNINKIDKKFGPGLTDI